MSEEITPQPEVPQTPSPIVEQSQQPIVSEVVVPEKPKVGRGFHKGRYGTLENLPPEVKNDMEEYMRKENPHAAKKYMAEKYGETYPKLKEVSAVAFGYYFKRHNVKTNKELSLQLKSATPPQEMLEVIEDITNPEISLEDKRKALVSLYNACKTRSEMMEQRQTTFIDPNLEALILANRKEEHALIKTVATLNEQLSKDTDKDFVNELESFTQVVLSAVFNSYKLTNGDNNFSLFRSHLDENLTNLLKQYRSAKDRLKKEPN